MKIETSHLFYNVAILCYRLRRHDYRALLPFFGLWATYWLTLYVARATFNSLPNWQLAKIKRHLMLTFLLPILVSGHTLPVFSLVFTVRYIFMLSMLLFVEVYTQICVAKCRRRGVNKLYVASLHGIIGIFCLSMTLRFHDELNRHGSPRFLSRLALYYALAFLSSARYMTNCVCHYAHREFLTGPRLRLLPWSLPIRDFFFTLMEIFVLGYYHLVLWRNSYGFMLDVDSVFRLVRALDEQLTTLGRLFTLAFIFLLPSQGSLNFETCQLCQRKLRAKAVKKLQCGHYFDMACLYLHMRQSSQCPVCQSYILYATTPGYMNHAHLNH